MWYGSIIMTWINITGSQESECGHRYDWFRTFICTLESAADEGNGWLINELSASEWMAWEPDDSCPTVVCQ